MVKLKKDYIIGTHTEPLFMLIYVLYITNHMLRTLLQQIVHNRYRPA